MQTIAAFATRAVAAVGHAAATVGRAVAGSGAPAAGQAASTGSKILAGLRVGTSVVSALSVYQQAQAQAQAQKQEAANEDLQARQEFIQSAERASAIQFEVNRVVEQQLAAAGAMGIDAGSGSVIEAQQQARNEADRQLTIDRNTTEMNAALRRSRASYKRYAAGLTQEAGFLGGLEKVGQAAVDMRRIG